MASYKGLKVKPSWIWPMTGVPTRREDTDTEEKVMETGTETAVMHLKPRNTKEHQGLPRANRRSAEARKGPCPEPPREHGYDDASMSEFQPPEG